MKFGPTPIGEAEGAVLAHAVRTELRGGDRIALSGPGGPGELISFAELDAVTDRGAAALWRLGLRPTDRVLFQMRNCKELVYAFFSCLKIGVIPVCTLAAHREQEIGYIGRHTNDRAMIEEGLKAMSDAEPSNPLEPLLRGVWLDGGKAADQAAPAPTVPPAAAGPSRAEEPGK